MRSRSRCPTCGFVDQIGSSTRCTSTASIDETGKRAEHREGVALKRAQPLAARAVAAPLATTSSRCTGARPVRTCAPVSAAMRAPTTARPAMLKRIDLLVLQLAPQLERLLARLRQRDELDAAKAHPALALPVLVAQDPRLGAADHLQVEPAPVTVASRLGVLDAAPPSASPPSHPRFYPRLCRGFQRIISERRRNSGRAKCLLSHCYFGRFTERRGTTPVRVRGGRIRRRWSSDTRGPPNWPWPPEPGVRVTPAAGAAPVPP